MILQMIKEIRWDKVTWAPSNNVQYTIKKIRRSELFCYRTVDISGLSQADVT